MTEIYAAHYWRITPKDFRDLGRDEKAEIVASYLVSKEIEAYYATERMKRTEQEKRFSTGNEDRAKRRF
jgi:hypothetical protein